MAVDLLPGHERVVLSGMSCHLFNPQPSRLSQPIDLVPLGRLGTGGLSSRTLNLGGCYGSYAP